MRRDGERGTRPSEDPERHRGRKAHGQTDNDRVTQADSQTAQIERDTDTHTRHREKDR